MKGLSKDRYDETFAGEDAKWRMRHQRLMPAGNIELFNHLFLPSAVFAVINIKLKCFLRKYGISQSDLLIV